MLWNPKVPRRYFTWRFFPGCSIIFQVNEWVTLNFAAQVTLPGKCSSCQTWPNCMRHRWKPLNQVALKLTRGNNKLFHCLSSEVGLLHSKEHWTIRLWTSNDFMDWHPGRVIVWQISIHGKIWSPSCLSFLHSHEEWRVWSGNDLMRWRQSHSLPSFLSTWLTPPSSV